MLDYSGTNSKTVLEVLSLVNDRRILRGYATDLSIDHALVDVMPTYPSPEYMGMREDWYAECTCTDVNELDSILIDTTSGYDEILHSLPPGNLARQANWILNDLYKIARARAQGSHCIELERMYDVYAARCFPVGWQGKESTGRFLVADASSIPPA